MLALEGALVGVMALQAELRRFFLQQGRASPRGMGVVAGEAVLFHGNVFYLVLGNGFAEVGVAVETEGAAAANKIVAVVSRMGIMAESTLALDHDLMDAL